MYYFSLEPIQIVDIILVCLIALAFSFFYLFKIKNKIVIFLFLFILTAYILTSYFNLTHTADILKLIFLIFTATCSFVNISSFRNILLSLNLSNKKKKHTEKTDVEIDKDNFYRIIDEAVSNLSRTKTGALLTFEKKDDLSEIMKNGTIINAPLTTEIIQTIFYPGTRLHDGAIVIRGNTIVAASVYYTLTKRALMGKYGSRHRAAFGICETTDSVTVIVSEETGIISIAYEGMLEPVARDDFLEEFKEYMEK